MDKRSSSFGKKPGNHKPFRKDDKPGSYKGSKPFKKKEEDGRSERPARKFDSDDKGEKRSFDKPSGFKRRDDGDGPKRPYGTRDSGGAGKSGGYKKDFGSSDRPKRSFDKDDKSGRPYEKREGGLKKDFNSSDRPKRSFGNDDKPGRPYEKKEGGFKKDFSSSDRPKRSFGNDDNDGGFKKPFEKREGGGKRTPYSGRIGDKAGTINDSNRKPFEKKEGGKKPYGKSNAAFKPKRQRSFEGDEEKRPFDKEDGIKTDFKAPRKPGLFDKAFEDPDKPKRPAVKKEKTEEVEEEKPKTAFRTPHKFKRAIEEINKEDDEELEELADKPKRKRKVLDEPDIELAPNTLMPLNKYIAHSGECSRRDAADLVKQGKVKVNGELVMDPGYRVKETDQVTMLGKKLKPIRDLAYVLLNKPKGYITTTDDPQERDTVMDLVQGAEVERLFPVGRLDRNTSGLLLLTNDGDLAQKLAHPSHEIKKVYHVTLDKPITKADFDKVIAGVELEDGIAIVDELAHLEEKNELGLEIHSGKNRIVRRIFESLGYQVEKLDRVMYAGLTKKNLPRGKWRFLEEKEIILLKHFKN